MPGSALRILVVTPFRGEGWTWLEAHFRDRPFRWTFANLDRFGRRQPVWLEGALWATRLVTEHDVIVTHAPYMSLYLALAMRLTGRRRPHLAFSFNHGNKRFFGEPLLTIARAIFPDVGLFVSYSQAERQLLGHRYRIPPSRFPSLHWAVQPPKADGSPPDYAGEPGSYLCCIGRNNRDFETLFEAVRGLKTRIVAVCAADRLKRASVPENVIVRTELSPEECTRLLAGAAASIVPLQDASTGAGHMTIVSAMQLGLPQIITRVDVINDYVADGKHALM